VFETNIVALHDQIPHVSLPNPPFLRSRPRSRQHDDAKDVSSSLLSLRKRARCDDIAKKERDLCNAIVFLRKEKTSVFSDRHHKKITKEFPPLRYELKW
jgi:hypothetical protein